MSINDLFSLIVTGNTSEQNTTKEIIYNTNELLEHYPMFTKYSLNMAIKKNNLPHFRVGHKRYFKKEAIDKWIINQYNINIIIKKRK